MTSRALFYKGMIEDLRHRIWMIALSCLASFMAMPVFFLLLKQDWDRRIINWYPEVGWNIEEYKVEAILEFFNEYLTITGGVVLGVGALIVGIFGFRFVFSKKMVDLYHSIPITRKQLFFIHYLNGFLIWFVPMIMGAAVCALMSLAFIGDFVAWMSTLATLIVTVSNLVLTFLMIYHLAIVAVMLSGNVLNTLLNGTIISFAALAAYGMIEVFMGTYFETYYSLFDENVKNIIWASPIPGAIYQLMMRCTGYEMVPFVLNMVVMLALLIAGFLLYICRPSELAEQGMKIKAVQILFKSVITILAGMAGWIFFGLLTNTSSIGWTVFGTVLASVLVYGILDIIFNMDFKAFFKNKMQMLLTTVAAILIGFTFLFDWVGFDTYVPDKDQIAEMGIYINGLGYNGNYDALDGILSTQGRIDRMEYTDAEVIYPFLEKVSGNTISSYAPINGDSSMAYVRVTEKNGKTYYRCYRVYESDEELVVPILRSDAYIKTNVQIPELIFENFVLDEYSSNEVQLESMREERNIYDVEHAKEILKAYNADMLANPDLFIYQKDEIFAKIFYRCYDERYYSFRLDLYESMDNVVSVLEKYGYDNVLAKTAPEDVSKIEINTYLYDTNNLKLFFGLEEAPEMTESVTEDAVRTNYGSYVEVVETKPTTAEIYKEYNYYAIFQNKEDIAELLDIVTIHRPNNYSLFEPGYVGCDVHIWMENGRDFYAQLKKGVLPEKFLDSFQKEEIIYD